MKGTILILALTPNTPLPAPVSPVVTSGGMERATGHLAPRMPIGYV